MGTAWEWTWESPGRMGIGLGFSRAGTVSCRQEPATAAVQDRRTPNPASPVLRASASRELLDFDSRSADSRPHRATRVAPHVIESRTLGSGTMRGGERELGRM